MLRFFLLLSILCSITLGAQNNAIASGEKLTYTASYNMSGILTDLAQVTMETTAVKTSKATLLRLKCTALTFSKWDNFFKIRDLYESYVNPKTLTPYLYNRDINEGGYYKNMKYTFSHKNKVVKSVQKKKNNQIEKKDVPIGANTKDIISALYSLRLFDYANMTKGSKKTFNIIFDRKESSGYITFLGKETISTAIGRKECYKLKVGSNQSNVVNGTLWLTADKSQIIVFGQFKIPVGNGEIRIKSASGLVQ